MPGLCIGVAPILFNRFRPVPIHSPVLSQGFLFIFAAAITLSGVCMQWRVHVYCMSAEEAVKDGKLTQDQATRRLLMFKWGSHVLTIGGMALLLASALAMPE